MISAAHWFLLAACIQLAVVGGQAETTDNEQSATTDEQAAVAKQPWVRGSFESEFDGVWAGGDSDLNLDQHLRFLVTPPEHDRIRIRGSLWMHEDLDSDEDRNGVLWDINDTYDSDVRARLLYLYVEADDLWGDSTLRVGRQRIQEGAAFNRIDGAYFKQYRSRWDWYAFAGARASLYEDTHTDLTLGGGASFQVTDMTRLALDAYYGEEIRESRDEVRPPFWVGLLGFSYPRSVDRTVNDNLVSLSVWQDFTPNLRLFGQLSMVDGQGDQLVLHLLGYVPDWDVTYEVAYRRQLSTVGDRVSDLTGYFRIVGELEEYDNVFLSVHRPLTEKLTLSLEGEYHDARNSDAYTANRDFIRAAGILSVQDLFPELDASVCVEKWDVDDGEGAWILTGEVEKEWNDFTVTVGTDYEHYEDRLTAYTPVPYWIEQLRVALIPGVFTGSVPLVWLLDTPRVETHENIYSFYTKVRWAIKENQAITAKITYEEDDGPDSPYWRVQTGYAIRF